MRGNKDDAIAVAESKGFFYLTDMKFDHMENGLGSRDLVKWKIADEQVGFYSSTSA